MSRTLSLPFLFACLPVVVQGQITFTASPASLTFTYQQNAVKLPAGQKISVKASSGTPAYAVANLDLNALWLTAGPNSGNLPASLSVTVNPTGLGVGQYSSTGLTVSIVGASSPITISVTLNVTAPPATLTVSPTTLTFSAPPSPVTGQFVQLSTDGAPISFTATSGAPWLSVSPAVGVVLPGEQEMLTITPDPTSLIPQAAAYVAKISIVVSGTATAMKAQTIIVNFVVDSSTPIVSNIWPPTLPVNAGARTITVYGTNFYKATVAFIEGLATPLVTTVLSSSALLAVVPASQVATTGTLNIVASNPSPGGSSSSFQVAVANVPAITAVTNVASYGAAGVSPGELITIFGTDLGPPGPASLTITNGLVDTTLSGVSLTIDNIPAPLLYVSQNQVTAQVPYEVSTGVGKQVVLTNGTNPNATSTITIGTEAPGVFTSDGSGAGQAAALNYGATSQSYSLNTAANPALAGDTILLYLTGEGDYNPTLTPRTGLIVPTLSPLPQLNPLPTVTIGGAVATVDYAGPLIGSILGLLQINCVVPAGSTTGKAVPVVVSVNGTSTQTNVTLSIHP